MVCGRSAAHARGQRCGCMRSSVRNLVIAGLAIGLLALFLRNAHLPSVWQEIRHAELGLIAAAIASMFVNLLLRGVRWQYLLRPVGNVSFSSAVRALAIGFAATALLPARAGEFLRPYVLARREGFSATAAFATVVLERVLDPLSVVSGGWQRSSCCSIPAWRSETARFTQRCASAACWGAFQASVSWDSCSRWPGALKR